MENKTDISLLKVRKLPIFQNLDEMSNVSGFSKQLIYYYAISEKSEKYEIIKVPKKDGGTRVIYAPKYALKMLQRWVLVNILYKVECSSNAFAFKKSEGSPLKKMLNFMRINFFCLKWILKIFFHQFQDKEFFICLII